MGALWSSLAARLFPTKEYRMLMLGLDAAGKTTILYKLKLGELVTSIPTIGFNVETVQYHNVFFTVWDVGGQTKLRPLWRHYYRGTQGLIFVVDSNDVNRIQLAAQELHGLLAEPDMRDATVLVFCNKQDLPHAMSATEVGEALGLYKTRQTWYVQPCTATTGEGLYEGLDWLAKTLASQQQSR